MQPSRPSRLNLFSAAVVALALLPFSALTSPASAGPRPMTAHDLVTMQRISEPQASPDGATVVYALRETDMKANRGRTDLWAVSVTGDTPPRRLTRSEASEYNPRFAPDGRSVYFLSSRSGSSQVWRLPLDGGEARQVTDLPLGVGSFALSPRGDRLVLGMRADPRCATLECTLEHRSEDEAKPATGRLYESLFVRHWDTWKDDLKGQLFTLSLGAGGMVAEGAGPVLITRGLDASEGAGMEADVPSSPFGGPEEYTFTPDGSAVVFTARLGDAGEPWSTNFDLWVAPADGSAAPRNLTRDNPAWDTLPVFSPDGSNLVYLAMSRPGFEADRFRIMVLPWPTGPRVGRPAGAATPRGGAAHMERGPIELAPAWDRSPYALAFSPDGKTLYANAAEDGRERIFALDLSTGPGDATRVRAITREGSSGPPVVAGGHLVFPRERFQAPVDLYRLEMGDTEERTLHPLTAVNAGALAELEMGESESFTFPGWNGEQVQAWVVKPARFAAGQRYPLAFIIHGGPQGSITDEFHYRWNPQIYAGAGYGVVMVNFHGSTGFGQAFTDSISRDWGGKPLEDLEKGLAAALARYPWIDGDRACALGASYGGYMINWIAGKWTGDTSFRCLVNHDGIFDQRMMYYATEELWFPEWEHDGPYYASPEAHERHNPVLHVTAWKTPMLVVHGALDYRIPETQGLAAFTALQRQGIPSQLLFFPDENHWVLSPANSILWHETVLAWLERWTSGE